MTLETSYAGLGNSVFILTVIPSGVREAETARDLVLLGLSR